MSEKNESRDWELTCDHCNGDGVVYVERRVGPCQTDIQTFKEECECCEGRGFTIAFEDIPGIAEYVRKIRPAPSAPGDAQDGLAEAQRLAQALFQRHFAQDEDYASGRVKWEVLGDLPGVLSQIDNMVCGLIRPDAPAAGDALDSARLDFLVTHGAWIAWSKDHELCRVFHRDEDGSVEPFMGWRESAQAAAYTPRDAIDAAMAALAAQVPQQGEA